MSGSSVRKSWSTRMPRVSPRERPASTASLVSGATPTAMTTGVGGDLAGGAVRARHPDAAVLDCGDGGGEEQLDAVVVQLLVERLNHVVVVGRKDLVGALDHRDALARAHEVLRHLDADEASADHGDTLDVRSVDVGLERADVSDVAHAEDVLPVDARDGAGHDGGCPGGEDKLVVGLVVGLARREVAHGHGMGLAVDGDGLAPGPDLDVVLAPEALRVIRTRESASGTTPPRW